MGSGASAATPPFGVHAPQNYPAAGAAGEYFNTAGVMGTAGACFILGNGYGGNGGADPRYGTGGQPGNGSSGTAGYGYGAGGGGQFVTISTAAMNGGNGYAGMALLVPLS